MRSLARPESSPPARHVLLDGVLCDQRIELRLCAVGFRPQQPAQPLRLFLPRTVQPGDLYCDASIGQVNRHIRHARYDQHLDLARTKSVVQHVALRVRRFAGYQRRTQQGRNLVKLSRY